MADITVTPSTLELSLTIESVTLPGAEHIEYPSTLALDLQVKSPKLLCQFPILTRDPNLNFRDEPSAGSVLLGETGSGYPVLNKINTFNGRDIEFDMPSVPDADKVQYIAFYEANKDTYFPWYNKQDGVTYNVIFAERPRCRLADGIGDTWNMTFHFIQVSD